MNEGGKDLVIGWEEYQQVRASVERSTYPVLSSQTWTEVFDWRKNLMKFQISLRKQRGGRRGQAGHTVNAGVLTQFTCHQHEQNY